MLVQVRTHRLHCNAVPRKIFGSSGGSLLPTGETPVRYAPPYSTTTDPEPLNSVLLVLGVVGLSGAGQNEGKKRILLFVPALSLIPYQNRGAYE